MEKIIGQDIENLQERELFIKDKPVPAVLITFTVMLVVNIIIRVSMKYKLTTAEWQRDSLEQKLDSIKELDNRTTSYYRYQSYD